MFHWTSFTKTQPREQFELINDVALQNYSIEFHELIVCVTLEFFLTKFLTRLVLESCFNVIFTWRSTNSRVVDCFLVTQLTRTGLRSQIIWFYWMIFAIELKTKRSIRQMKENWIAFVSLSTLFLSLVWIILFLLVP